ncbi:uncharacterized protein LOC133499039 isoform X2 [Syngnathoides biaculeatus]|uniref:uncharacterized protein LOC133499039 isoform X2 n=1 Tax=Syngnathoides biaculeatus TaxID=300417 RepID=UPI002ADD4D7C|nr:uncharacterized protein LOC133499039 isoform X2 [Syngnathoides biaculeatus]
MESPKRREEMLRTSGSVRTSTTSKRTKSCRRHGKAAQTGASMKGTFDRSSNTRHQAPGPDRVSPSCLKVCADQLAPVFAKIFNRSRELAQRLACHLPVDLQLPDWQDTTVKLLKFADDTTVIGLIKDGEESAYRQEVERLEEASFTTAALDAVQLPCFNHRDFQVLGNYSPRGLEVGYEHHLHSQKSPAKDVLLAASKETRPVTRAAEIVLHSGYQIRTVYLHHSLAWSRHKKGLTQTTTDNQNC